MDLGQTYIEPSYMDIQGTQKNCLSRKAQGTWADIMATLEVQVELLSSSLLLS